MGLCKYANGRPPNKCWMFNQLEELPRETVPLTEEFKRTACYNDGKITDQRPCQVYALFEVIREHAAVSCELPEAIRSQYS